MKARQLLLNIVCVLILSLDIFFFAGGFARDLADEFISGPFDFIECVVGLFLIISLLSASTTCFCRLFRIHFAARSTERYIALGYLCLAALCIYPLALVSVFATMTFSPEAGRWFIIRNELSVLGMVLSITWMVVLCVKLLVRRSEGIRGQRPLKAEKQGSGRVRDKR